MRRRAIAVAGLSGVVLAVVLAVLVAALTTWRGDEIAQATPDVMVTTVAIDMDPSATPPNDEDTVGSIERCAEVANAEGTTFQVDVVLDGIPNFGADRTNDLGGFNYYLYFPGGTANVSAQTHWDAGATVAILDRAAGSGANLSFTEAVPDADGVHKVAEGDFGTSEAGSGGVLGRYTLTVQSGAASGVYYLSLDTVSVSDGAGFDAWDAPGDGIDKDEDGAVDEDVLLDGATGYGVIALGVSCPPAGQGSGAGALPEQEGEAEAVRLRWGEISVEVPAGSGIQLGRLASVPWLNDGKGSGPAILVTYGKSYLAIDAHTGQVLDEAIRAQDRGIFDIVLATVRIEGERISGAPWPYGATLPTTPPRALGAITYIEPDPASGIVAGPIYAYSPGGPSTILRFYNTRSVRLVDAERGQLIEDLAMHPEDKEAFDRLMAQIRVASR